MMVRGGEWAHQGWEPSVWWIPIALKINPTLLTGLHDTAAQSDLAGLTSRLVRSLCSCSVGHLSALSLEEATEFGGTGSWRKLEKSWTRALLVPEGHTLKRMNGKKLEIRWFTQCASDHEGDKENHLDRAARSNRWVGNCYLFITSIFSDYKNKSLLF